MAQPAIGLPHQCALSLAEDLWRDKQLSWRRLVRSGKDGLLDGLDVVAQFGILVHLAVDLARAVDDG